MVRRMTGLSLLAAVLAGTALGQSTATNVVSGNITIAGQRDSYVFSIDTTTRFYFDAFSNVAQLAWTLSGPEGAVVSQRSFQSSDAQSIGDPTVLLPSGNYTMTIQSLGGTTNAYAFRFVNLADATLLSPGTVVSNALAPANRTDLYQFNAAAGDRYYFHVLTRTSLPNTYWRLMDPYGNQVFSQGFVDAGTPASPVSLPAAGTYALMVEGYIGDSGTGSYSFNVVPEGNVPPPAFTGTPMNLGDLIVSNLTANTTNNYIFTLPSATRVIMNSETNSSGLAWTLRGPSGVVVNQQALNSSGGINGYGPIMLAVGNYQLSVTGNTGNPYQFRLLDLAGAGPLTPGTTVNGALTPASAAALYHFNTSAGNKYYFDSLGVNNLPNTFWRLVDPNGVVLFSTYAANGRGPVTLNVSGTHTLMIEGYWGDTGSGNYQFNVAAVTDGLQALTLGSTVSGTIGSPGQRQQYTFSLGSATRLYFDSLTNTSNVRWSLDGPGGNVVNNRNFNGSDAQNYSNPVLNLPAGNYTLTVLANANATSAYQFRLFDLTTATALTLGSVVNGNLNPANSTVAYQFALNSPGKVFYNYISSSGLPDAYVRLIDEHGNIPMATSLANDVGPLSLPAGNYTLLVEGYIGDYGNGSYSFNVVPGNDGLQALGIGTTVNGTIASPGQRQQYTFSLASSARLYFDSLTNTSSLRWSLDGPEGNLVNNRSFNGSDAQNNGGYPLLNLSAANYILTVFANGDSTGAFQFRLFDVSTAAPLTLGAVVNGNLNPANSTALYQFNLGSPGKIFYDYLTSSGLPDTYVRLLDNNGNVPLATSLSSITGPLSLPAGSYTLLIEGYIGDYGNGSYSFNLLPVTDNSQPLTLGGLVTGAISSPGQHQQYTFALGTASRLYFDSLTNTSSLRWSLDGPAGNVVNNRTFNGSDAQNNNGTPVLALPPGNYTLTVLANSDSTGAFQFRLSDLSTATTLTPGTVVNGSLNPANSTAAYQFSLGVPTRMLYDYLSSSGVPNALVRLIDDHNNLSISASLGSITGPLLLPAGHYTFLVEGYIGDYSSGNYSFNFVPVIDGSQVLVIGSTVNGVINSPGQSQKYAFTLGAAARLYFDSLTNSSSLHWSLDGPTGNVVNSRNFNGSDGQNIGNPVLPLPAGSYTLTVTANADTTSAYSFRLSDLAAATALTPGTPVSANNFLANSTALYQFNTAAGDRFSFNFQGASAMPSAYWRLVDPYNNIVFSQGFSSSAGTFTLGGGTYTVLIEGYIGDYSSSAVYGFDVISAGNVPPTPYAGAPLGFGATTLGNLPTSSSVSNYIFTLGAPARLFFDAMSNAGFTWSLIGPPGTVVNNRGFQSSDNIDISDPSLNLPAGNYQLRISGAAGTYQFRLLDAAGATVFTPGTPVNGTLTPANSTVLYQFTGTAGQMLYFNGQGSSGFTYQPYCRLYGPLGNIIMAQSVNNDIDTFTLAQSGTYTLSVEGRIYDNNASGNYAFNLLPVANVTNVLSIGSQVTGTIATRGQRQYYTFTLPAATTLYFDSETNADFYWRLDAPWGQVVNSRSFTGSDWLDIGDPSLPLPAGTYTLTVVGNNFQVTGPYQFRLLDFASATPLTPGTPVNTSLTPASSATLYQFTGTAGQPMYFNGQGSSGFSYQPYCRLYAPAGNILVSQYVNNDVDTFTLPQSGTYTLTVEGRAYDTHASGTYSFNLFPVTNATNALSIGSLISGNISTRGQRQYYTFALGSPATLYFDALTNADFYWRLDAPWGQVVNWRSFSSTDAQDISDPSLQLAAGTYTLAVAGNNFQVTGNYQFRLIDFAGATAVTPGTPVNGILNPADSTVLYQFTGSAGQMLYFNGQGSSGFSYQPYCRLYAPLGNIVFAQSVASDVDTFTLPQSGTYTLTVEGRVYDTHASGTYSFNLLPVTNATNALSIGSLISGNISTRGQRQFYAFSLAGQTTLYFDALTNASFSWRLDAPWGQVVNWRSFLSSDGSDISDPSLPLPAGSYILTIAGDNFMVTGNYQFRLLDFAGATVFTPGTVVSNTLSPADTTVLYRFSGTGGDRYYFDGQLASGFTYTPYCRLYAPAGNLMISQPVNQDVDTFALPQSGTYTLTVEGRVYDNNASGNYAFNLVPNPQGPPQLLFPTNVAPDLSVAGISVSPPSGLQSGGTATVQWTDQNTGNGPTSGSFTDRVTIRNGTGLVLVDSFLPYNESDSGNGPIAPSGSRNRQLAVQLPDGTNSVGTLQVAVTVDALNTIAESNETNNSSTTTISVSLAPYPDLLVSSIATAPTTRWLPGSGVTVNWQLTNSGSGFARSNWSDTVVIRNTNTSAVILSATTNYNLSDPGNGIMGPGEFRNRRLAFTMPNDANAYGVFAVTVTADSANQVFEYTADGTAELNNSTTITVISAPDLVPGGLNVVPNVAVQSGGSITINWTDTNTGTVDTGSGFYDRVTVVNNDTSEVLLNTTLYYDPNANGNGPIPPGAGRGRSMSFQLPDGPRGAGNIQVSIAADTFNQVPEFNATGTGELNNGVSTSFTSTLANYPDLRAVNLSVQPLVLNSGTNVTFQWQDTNSGSGIALASWYDHVTIVNTNTGVTLLDTEVFYDTSSLGPLTNGTARNRLIATTLPNGANGAGTLLFTVTVDQFNNVFEYNPGGTAELNNASTITAISGIAPYPDLQVTGLDVQPASLASGGNLTVQWQDSNTGTTPTVGNWYDRVTIVNTNSGATLVDTTLYYDAAGLGALTNGTSRNRSFHYTLPFTSNGAGGLRFTVAADTYNSIFEYNPGGTGENNNSASIVRTSTLTPLPDLVITSLTNPASALTSQLLSGQLRVANQGLLDANADILQQVFLSTSPTPGSGTLVSLADYNGPLGVGQFLDQSFTFLAPATPGTYWLIAQADGNNNVTELAEDNNYFVSPTPLNVVPAYTATVAADIHMALANTPIPMHGHATLGGSGNPAAFVPVTIHLKVRGTDRTFTVLTAGDGTFTNLFQPLPNEAGVYQISAALPTAPAPSAQDTFVLIGMSVASMGLVDLTEGTSVTNSTRVDNLSDVPLTSLSVTVVTNQPNLVVTPVLGTNHLGAFANTTLSLTVQALNASIVQSPVIVRITSAEGATVDFVFIVRVEALRPNLVLNPSSLQGVMLRGAQTPVAFTVANNGGVATGPLEVVLPNFPWMTLASADHMPPLPPGSNTVVTILLTPAADLGFGTYNGSLVLRSTNSAAQESFSFRVVSSATGNMFVSAEDEYTYFAPGSPRVTNATVVVSDAITGMPVVTNYTGSDGTVGFSNLTEAYYIVDVGAEGHSSFRETVLVPGGVTTNVVAFLTRQTVTYNFTVTPTTVADQYIFTIDSTFETQVPVPVVTIEPASLDLAQYSGNQFQVLYTVANHGLIDAEHVFLNFPNTANLQFTALVTNLGKLRANTSYTVPVLVTRTPAGPQKDYTTGTCSVTAQMLWDYLCGPNVVNKDTAYYVFDSTGCNLVDLYRQVYQLVPDNPGGGGPGGGGPVITSDEYFDYLNQFQNVTDFEPPPGYHFQCRQAPPGPLKLETPYAKDGTSVCAKVEIRLDQRAVLTRDAFRATLQINNDTTNILSNVQATIQISDLAGHIVNTNFAISDPDLAGLTGVDGTGNLPGTTVGTATWTLIPTLDATPTNGMTLYLVGGTLNYTQDGTPISVPLAAAPIQVYPQPELMVRYFHQRDVFADDPFTPQVEPSIPYSLAVQVNNVGHGAAQSLTISSGRPQIVDNVKGLLIDFNIIGTAVENRPVTPALSVDFGRIDPGTNAIARWLFTSSIQGSFTNFSASFSQVDSFGKPRLSLIRSVEIHELTHIVQADRAFEDNRPDFLVNDVSDQDFIPDTLYLSDGSIVPVSAVTNGAVLGTLADTNLSITMTSAPPAGWCYFRFGDPGPGSSYQLAHVLRADHSEVGFGTNVWTTDRSFRGSDQVPIHTNLVHLLDHNSSGVYTLVYTPAVTNNVDTTPPTSAVSALPPSSPPNFTVQWNGLDNVGGSGIAYFDIYVSTNGGPFGPWLTNTTTTAAIFNGAPGQNFGFFSRATDVAGNHEALRSSADGQTSTTSPGNSPPVITAIPTHTVVEGALFTFTPSANDPDLPAQTLTWTLLPGAPPAALILPSTGRITWQTALGSGGTTNPFTLVVTDNGTPSLSATQTFNVVVAPVNHAPSIGSVAAQVTVEEQTLLSIQLTATDPDLPAQTLAWQLGPGAPFGMSLNPSTGLLSWTPAHSQSPSTNVITVTVRDNGSPSLSDSRNIVVVVNRVNHAPVVGAISTQFAYALLPLTFAITATDPDVPAQTLTYSLDPGGPSGSVINPTTGVFTWTPSRAQAPSTNNITVRVTDNGYPAMSATRTFTVVVSDYLEISLGSTILQAGQTGAVTIAVSTTTPTTNLGFTLDVGTAGLTNFTLVQPAAPLASFTLTSTGPNQFLANFTTIPGQNIHGALNISIMNFHAPTGSPSAFVPLKMSNLAARQPNGVLMPRVLSDDGRVVFLNGSPLVEGLMPPGQFEVILYAPPGPSYTLQATPRLKAPSVWTPVWNGPIGASLFQVIPLPPTNSASFFRAARDPVLGLTAQTVGGQFQVSVQAPPGPGYVLESTPSLVVPVVWSPIWTGAVPSIGVQTVPLLATNSRSFFRARAP
jgi:hypothetical protein